MDIRLLIDFGSTFTKLVAVDLKDETIVGRVQVPSTVDTDVTIGLKKAIENLREQTGIRDLADKEALACSSAAGGLRMVCLGLVPSLTCEAAIRAALGAGAKVVGYYSYKIAAHELQDLEELKPDMLLLTGGTDGGDEKNILYNAERLANSRLTVPIVVAGNKVVRSDIASILESAGKYVKSTDNVMPEIDVLCVEPCREVIREIFMSRIIKAKGIDKAKKIIKNVLMPTPAAVLRAAELLAEGYEGENGLGELMVVDIGGATSDVHSIAWGRPIKGGVILKGLEEPYLKRTVEGDLGVRYSATKLLELVGERRLMSNLPTPVPKERVQALADSFHMSIGKLAETEEELLVEAAMSRMATEIAVERHVGYLEEIHMPQGRVLIQRGKDLTNLRTVVGSGGPIVFSPNPKFVLQAALYNETDPWALKPRNSTLYVDKRYIMYAAGILAEESPGTAFRIMKRYIIEAGSL